MTTKKGTVAKTAAFTIFLFLLAFSFLAFSLPSSSQVFSLKTFIPQAYAQSFGETLDLTMSPQNPAPGERVSLSVKNVAVDLDKQQITWSLNGKVAKQGIGEKSFEFGLGAAGSVSSVTVSAGGLSKNIVIRPADVDLIWETDGYVPPFYKGKTLRPFQGNVRLVAVPHFVTSGGAELDPKKLTYTWRNNGVLNASGSGYGRNFINYSGSIISRPLRIEVAVSSADDNYKASREVVVEETAPQVFLYEDHPLYGILYNRALGAPSTLGYGYGGSGGSGGIEFPLETKELKISTAPYFFSPKNKNDSRLKYSWGLNGAKLNNPNFRESATFRQEGIGTGSFKISLSVENTKEFLQNSSAAFNLRFGEKSASEAGESF